MIPQIRTSALALCVALLALANTTPVTAQAQAADGKLCFGDRQPNPYDQAVQFCVVRGYAGDGMCIGYTYTYDAGEVEEDCLCDIDAGNGICPAIRVGATASDAGGLCFGEDDPNPYNYTLIFCVNRGHSCIGYYKTDDGQGNRDEGCLCDTPGPCSPLDSDLKVVATSTAAQVDTCNHGENGEYVYEICVINDGDKPGQFCIGYVYWQVGTNGEQACLVGHHILVDAEAAAAGSADLCNHGENGAYAYEVCVIQRQPDGACLGYVYWQVSTTGDDACLLLLIEPAVLVQSSGASAPLLIVVNCLDRAPPVVHNTCEGLVDRLPNCDVVDNDFLRTACRAIILA